MELGLALASIAVRVCTGLAIPATDVEAVLGTSAGGVLSEFVEEALTSSIETTATVAGDRLEDGSPAERIHHVGACRLGREKVKHFIGAFGLKLSAILSELDVVRPSCAPMVSSYRVWFVGQKILFRQATSCRPSVSSPKPRTEAAPKAQNTVLHRLKRILALKPLVVKPKRDDT